MWGPSQIQVGYLAEIWGLAKGHRDQDRVPTYCWPGLEPPVLEQDSKGHLTVLEAPQGPPSDNVTEPIAQCSSQGVLGPLRPNLEDLGIWGAYRSYRVLPPWVRIHC